MNYLYLKEPLLKFSNGTHVCPRKGISENSVFDFNDKSRRNNILLGAVGTNQNIELLQIWLEKISRLIPAKPSNQPSLFPEFIGFNKQSGYRSEFVLSDGNVKQLLSKEISEIITIKKPSIRIEHAVKLYAEKIKFLAQNKNPEVIICIISDELYEQIKTQKGKEEDQADDHLQGIETNFRRMLKATVMKYSNIPIQLLRENTLKGNPRGRGTTQDDATTAWNLSTALYYKSSNRSIPWRLEPDANKLQTCHVGVSFYRSRDRKSVFSSLAQVFDEMGRNVILRGTPVEFGKQDRRPYLDANQAYDLLTSALTEYRIAMNTNPARVVIHKTSQYSNDEIDGFSSVADEFGIDFVDMVRIIDSSLRLFRQGAYPPYRGSMIKLDKSNFLLYTRGSVPYYRTYPGKYIPQPLEIEIRQAESSPTQICSEILSLTKMNWNNTQFDRKYPITIECARNVGKIIKYLKPHEIPQANYRFYM